MKKLQENWKLLTAQVPEAENGTIENYTSHLTENRAAILVRLPFLPPDDPEYVVAGFTDGRLSALQGTNLPSQRRWLAALLARRQAGAQQ